MLFNPPGFFLHHVFCYGLHLQVITNIPGLWKRIVEEVLVFPCDFRLADMGAEAQPYRFTIRQVTDRVEWTIPGSDRWQFSPDGQWFSAVEREIHFFLAQRSQEQVFFHAAAVSLDGRAVLLPGQSHRGKTTLTRALITAGAGLLSDEYSPLDSNGEVWPFPRWLRSREPEGLRRLRPAACGWSGELVPYSVGAVLFLTYRRDATLRLDLLSPAESCLEFIANSLSIRLFPAAVIKATSRMIARQPLSLKGCRGDSEVAASALIERLRSSPGW
jgi:hypothetical protein